MCELGSPIKALSAELTTCNTGKSAVYCTVKSGTSTY